MFKYMYIDESGDLGEHGTKYFTIAGIIVDNPVTLSRIIKKLRKTKLKKKIKELPEIKANNSNNRVKEFILRKLSQSDCKIIAIVINKKDIKKYLFDAKEKLYNYLCGILVNKIGIEVDNLQIIIDQKHTNSLLREDLSNYLKNKICSTNNNLKLEVHHKISQSLNELQVVDFVAWSINRKFNVDDDYYFNIIKDKIIDIDNIRIWNNDKK